MRRIGVLGVGLALSGSACASRHAPYVQTFAPNQGVVECAADVAKSLGFEIRRLDKDGLRGVKLVASPHPRENPMLANREVLEVELVDERGQPVTEVRASGEFDSAESYGSNLPRSSMITLQQRPVSIHGREVVDAIVSRCGST